MSVSNKSFRTLMLIVIVSLSLPAMANFQVSTCNTKQLAGKWVFATNVGKFPEIGITAIGTMNIEANGDLDGVFDATIASTNEVDGGFLPSIFYAGSVTINADCTGTLSFVTDISERTDSIVVVSSSEILAMSQDPSNLWNYQIRRLPSRHF